MDLWLILYTKKLEKNKEFNIIKYILTLTQTMTICWNPVAQKILKDFFENIKQTWKPAYKFMVVHGPSNVWKSYILKNLIQDLLWDYYKTDFLYIKDLSEYLWKKHTIKIEVETKNQNIKIDGEGNFLDLGTREINEWIAKSSVWKQKIVLIENIERMTTSAANGFLKTFEEVYGNVLIIATSSNIQSVLDTITSRAFLIRFEMPSYEEVKTFLKAAYPDKDEKNIDLITNFSMWRIWFAKKIIENKSDNEFKDLPEILDYYQKYLLIINNKWNYNEKLNILNNVYKNGHLELFFDAIIYWLDKNRDYPKIEKIIRAKKMIEANVGVENVLFYINL